MNQLGAMEPGLVKALIKREQLALVGRMLKGLVHNVSGALQMIRLPLDLMELQIQQGMTPDLQPKLAAMQQGVNRLGQELELLSAKSAQFSMVEPRNFSMGQMASEQLEFWRSDMFFKHEAIVETELGGEMIASNTAYLDMALAFNALITNALDALRANECKRLWVKAVSVGGRAGILISDDGPGPSAEMAPVMFDAFTTDKGSEHDGLGLFLAAQAVAPWGGKISWVDDAQPGFLLSVPA